MYPVKYLVCSFLSDKNIQKMYAVDTWSMLTWKDVAANPYVEGSAVDLVTPS